VFPPLLDASGNSVRGVRVCRGLSQQLCLHMLAHHGKGRTLVRRSYRATDIRSTTSGTHGWPGDLAEQIGQLPPADPPEPT
jgi:Glutaminase